MLELRDEDQGAAADEGWPDPEQKPQPVTALPNWRPGDDVSWDEAYFGVRQDVYRMSDGPFEAAEQYCVMPECDCRTVTLRFDDLRSQQPSVAGLVTVKPTGETALEAIDLPLELLERLWTAFNR